jgi:hypothetical protein
MNYMGVRKLKPQIKIPGDRLADFCRKNYIRKLSLFGSVLREDFRPDSDIDVLVDFDPRHIPGLMRLVGMEFQLSDLFEGHKVEMVTSKSLYHGIRKQVLADAVVQYVEKR